MKKIKIGLVDDHRLFRTGVASFLETFEGFEVTLEASNGQDMIVRLDPSDLPDIVFMDINMPAMNGIQSVEWLKGNFPHIKVIVLSMSADRENVSRMIQLGVKGYLVKDCDPCDLEASLKTVAQGGVYFSPQIQEVIVQQLYPNHEAEQRHRLTDRELAFLKLTATDLTYKEIAELMLLSARTVDALRDNLFEKLQVRSRVGLVLYAIKNKLLDI